MRSCARTLCVAQEMPQALHPWYHPCGPCTMQDAFVAPSRVLVLHCESALASTYSRARTPCSKSWTVPVLLTRTTSWRLALARAT